MLQTSAPKRLYLLRHGHTFDPLPETKVPGKEALLSEKGHAQARQTAEYLSQHVKLDALFASGLERTQQTAAPLAELQKLTVQVEPALNEVPLPVPANPSYREVIEAYVALTQELQSKPHSEVQLHGISFAGLCQRYLEAMQRILNHPGEHLGIVAHGGTNIVLLAYFAGMGYHQMLAFYQENCCINIIDVLPPRRFALRQINHTGWDPFKTQFPIDWHQAASQSRKSV